VHEFDYKLEPVL